MRPPPDRLFSMAQLQTLTLSDTAARMVDEALTKAKDDPWEACRLLHALYPADGPWIASLRERMAVMLAIDTLLSFAPETRERLEAAEALADGAVTH